MRADPRVHQNLPPGRGVLGVLGGMGLAATADSVAKSRFQTLAQSCSNRADVLLLACTELPLAAARTSGCGGKVIDTTTALVNACVAWAKSTQTRPSDTDAVGFTRDGDQLR